MLLAFCCCLIILLVVKRMMTLAQSPTAQMILHLRVLGPQGRRLLTPPTMHLYHNTLQPHDACHGTTTGLNVH